MPSISLRNFNAIRHISKCAKGEESFLINLQQFYDHFKRFLSILEHTNKIQPPDGAKLRQEEVVILSFNYYTYIPFNIPLDYFSNFFVILVVIKYHALMLIFYDCK